jgi:hypothetical protein
VNFKRRLSPVFGNQPRSLRETENFLLLSRDLGFLAPDTHKRSTEKSDETARTLSGLIAAMRNQ